MHELVGAIVNYVVNSLWQAPLLLIAGAIITRIVRKVGPAAQHRVWVSTLVLAVLLPGCSYRPRAFHVNALLDNQSSQDMTAAPELRGDPSRGPQLRLAPLLYYSLLWGYLGLCAYSCGRLAWGLHRTRALLQTAAAGSLPAEAAQVWQECNRLFAVGCARVLSSAEISGPVTVGHWNAALLVPAGFFAQSLPEDLIAVFGHECAHIERRDFLRNLLYQAIAIPIDYHPATRFLKSRIAGTRELICDAMAAERVAGSESYARSLLRLAKAMLARAAAMPPQAIGMFDVNVLEMRIMSLMEKKQRLSRKSTMLLLGAGIVVLSFACFAAMALTVDVEKQANGNTQSQAAANAGTAGKVYRVGGAVSAPELIYAPDPEYSDKARRAKYQGVCVVSLIVDARGNPQRVRIERHLGMGLDEKAVEAVKQYRFTPALRKDKPVAVKANIEVNFRMY